MKTVTEQFDVQSTMVGEKIAMDIDTDSTVHLMGLLTDLYKDRLAAVIREYATNAWDAHIEAGITLPIEVTLPTMLAPALVIRDYGPGLDAEGVRTIYSKYGASTKRATDDQAGMLGLGCKAALTYTNQFTVTSVKDGTRLVVLVSRDEHGAGSMQLLDSVQTDDANGTEITVAIRRNDHYRCGELAEKFFSYWKSGTVLVNSNEPRSFAENALKISDDLYVVEGGQSMIVMGQVAYPHEIDLGLSNRSTRLVAFVPIGAVRPVPSREGLMDTKNTEAAVEKVAKSFHEHIKAAIQTAIDNAASPQDAIKAMATWQKYVPPGKTTRDFTYQETPIPVSFKLPDEDHTDLCGNTFKRPARILTAPFRDFWRKSDTDFSTEISIRDWPRVVWVYGYTPAKFTAIHKNKLRAWASFRMITANECETFVLLRGEAPDTPFIDPSMVVSWEDIKSIKLAPVVGYFPDKQIPGSYKVYTESGFTEELAGKDIRQDKPIFYGRGNQHYFHSTYTALKAFYPEFTLVCLPANRVAKFERDVPKAIHYRDALTTGYDKWAKQVDPKDLIAVAMMDRGLTSDYRALDASKIDDPDLAELVRISQRGVSALNKNLRAFGRDAVSKLTITDVLSERYPLYNSYQAEHDHTYLYLNMIYTRDTAAN